MSSAAARTCRAVPTSFVGGEGLLDEIAEQLRLGSLVTLTGTGGVGKTRAAIEFGLRHLADFDDGVFLVDLAPVADSGAVVGTLASACRWWRSASGRCSTRSWIGSAIAVCCW